MNSSGVEQKSFKSNHENPRYEKAWQRLMADEAELNKQFTGWLTVTRNPNQSLDPSKILPLVLVDEQLQDSSKFVRHAYDDLNILDANHGIRILANLAHYRRFLAYSVSYQVELRQTSLILNRPQGWKLQTMFYPFLRSFFHRAESFLDNLLYREMFFRAVEKAKNVVQDASVQTGPLSEAMMLIQQNQNSFFWFHGLPSPADEERRLAMGDDWNAHSFGGNYFSGLNNIDDGGLGF